jgi:hypothetical protein
MRTEPSERTEPSVYIEHAIDIDAPPDVVWALTLDVESWPDHTPTMTSVERLDGGPITIGSRARVAQPGQRARVWTVDELVDGSTFAWSARAMGSTMRGRHVIVPGPTGCRNTLTVEIEGPTARVLGCLVRRPIATAISKENEGFKTAAEAMTKYDSTPRP